ncbi:MAG TPA: lysylphosphatidylglycerol synthase transmembrane domain-containing protein, partial [Chitinophagaceae bacterium]|nr:lysylphosphatidylglycerol synthase transmembrane domain-containing protein [Chitinophagaceae bacterium]
MEESPKAESRTSKILKLILKIAITIVCLWYVSGKIDFAVAGKALAKANWFYLFLAFIMFLLSKIISAQRLNIYFRNIGINMPANQNLRLYWLGMFYNLFLPGSISGDAYKVVLLTRKYKVPYKKTTAAVLLDRFSGLLGLGFILAVYGGMVLKNDLYIASITGAAILGLILFYLLIKYYFPDFLESFFPTLLLGVLVQAA